MTTSTTPLSAPASAEPGLAPSYPAELSHHGLTAVSASPPPVVDPRLRQFRMPAEWELHERTLITWPTRRGLWAGVFDDAKREYATVARTIADFEPVTVVALPGMGQEVLDHCGTANIDVLEAPVDDSWIRDNGPLVVRDAQGNRLGVDFAFNSWGRKFLPYDQDAALTPLLLDHLGIERVPVDLVLEGGSISVDGAGNLVSTAQCLLHSNRNAGLSQAVVEDTLRRALGVETVLLLPFGHLDDRHTDGHVDGVCTYVAPGRVVAQTCGDTRNVNHEAMARNLRYLRDNTDRQGRSVEVLGLDLFSSFDLAGVTEYVSYPNFYVANGVVVVPVSGNGADDEQALELIGSQFPDRQTIGLPGRVIAYGGGGPHCITMQIPAAIAKTGETT
ncbi:agmatine deiminase family protein [Kribbella catacumbae]|uniref:agmatine deiminase family protein n=1 Tax=Kribbella catacumbae TaxID=460086 RepID=UPI0003A2A1E1|nr:agmatine deiminase family protein [Kribbella catacumbae]